MADIIASTTKLPAHLSSLGAPLDDDWGSGQSGGFPVISTKGKVFHIRRGDDTELVTLPDDPDEPAGSLQVVILKTHHGVAKTYFKGTYEEGSDDKPTCYSPDGIAPAADAEERQAKKCAVCKQNQWGSRITDSGKKAKRCSDVKRLAVAPAGTLNDPMLIRVPPTSLKTWDQYVDKLRKKGVSPAHVITRISFDPAVAHQSLVFKAVGFITEEMVPMIDEALQDASLDAIIGSDVGHAPDIDEEAPAPKAKKKRAAKKPANAEDDDGEGESEDNPPAPKAKKKRAAKKSPAAEAEDSDDDHVDEPVGAGGESAQSDGGDEDFDDLDFDDLDFGDDDEGAEED